MAIQFYGGLSNFNAYSAYDRIPKANPEDVNLNQSNELNKEQTNANIPAKEDYSLTAALENDTRSRVANLEDISLSFNKEESYDYLSNDTSVKNLDVQKAISDMKKDSILEEYQYFVGDVKNIFASDDGMVIPK